MTTPDFWNLAGRAGRLRENFEGIVWCIDPSSWEAKPFEGDRLSEIKSAFQSFVENGTVRDAAIAVLMGLLQSQWSKSGVESSSFWERHFLSSPLDLKLSESPRIPTNIHTAMVPIETRW